MRPAAVFDLDGTLIRGTSAERLLVPWLVRRRVVGWRPLAAAVGRAATLPVVGRTRALRRNKRWLQDVPSKELLPLLDAFLDEMVEPRWCAATRGRLEAFQAQGLKVFLLSGAPSFLVDAVTARLGADGGVGTRLERANGHFTGRLAGPHWFAEAKTEALRELATAHDLELSASWGFADHLSDLPFLECFGHPVVVDPVPKLERVARSRGWKVLTCGPGPDPPHGGAAPSGPTAATPDSPGRS